MVIEECLSGLTAGRKCLCDEVWSACQVRRYLYVSVEHRAQPNHILRRTQTGSIASVPSALISRSNKRLVVGVTAVHPIHRSWSARHQRPAAVMFRYGCLTLATVRRRWIEPNGKRDPLGSTEERCAEASNDVDGSVAIGMQHAAHIRRTAFPPFEELRILRVTKA